MPAGLWYDGAVRCLLATLWAVGCLAACTFDTSGIQVVSPSSDLSDVAALDRSGALEGGREAAADVPQSEAAADLDDLGAGPDQPALDRAPADQAPADQPVPDQPVPDLAKPPCNTTYGSVSGYKLCQETATECTFFFTSGSCDSKCQAHGGTCIKAAAENNNTCTESYSTTCDFVHGDGLCTCTR